MEEFSLYHATSDDFEEDSQDELSDDEELMELQIERNQQDQDPNVVKQFGTLRYDQ